MPTNHLGGPIVEGRDYFVAAPSSIGDVISQHSTLKPGDTGTVSKGLVQMSLAFLAVSVICFVWYFLTKNWMGIAGGMLFAGFAMLRALNTKRFECNYVGTNGFARFRAGKQDEVKPSIDGGVFTFDSAAYLYTNVIETSGFLPFYGQNAIYQWVPSGTQKAVVNIMTDQYVPSEKPTEEDVVCFLRAAEHSWTQHLLKGATATLDQGHDMEFPYRIGGKLVLSPSALSFDGKGNFLARIDEIGGIVHSQGDVLIVGKTGDKLWSGNCFHLANILLLEELLVQRHGFTRGDSGVDNRRVVVEAH